MYTRFKADSLQTGLELTATVGVNQAAAARSASVRRIEERDQLIPSALTRHDVNKAVVLSSLSTTPTKDNLWEVYTLYILPPT